MARRSTFFQDLMASVFERGMTLTRQDDRRSAVDLCDALISGRGEASGTKIAQAFFDKYEAMDMNARRDLLIHLAQAYDVDTEVIIGAAQAYAADPSSDNLKALQRVSEPKRLELLRRLNSAPGGTKRLVAMREDILALCDENPELKRADVDFEHLFSSWFNRGFLVLRPIDWQTPAYILEKIITYEAVHAIDSWTDLRSRLLPEDRRCYAFFHPAMPDEPLIFVEVALTNAIATSIQDVLADGREPIAERNATTAVFYSISNCQKGLRGVSFGNFLIKQVASELSADLPNLKTFVTLSPIPGFAQWLRSTAAQEAGGLAPSVYKLLSPASDRDQMLTLDSEKDNALALAARYFLLEKRKDGQPIDPVARFHLGNGASLRQINWLGDVSNKGLNQSHGLMVNYLYNLAEVEVNHEAYAQSREVTTQKAIRTMAEKARFTGPVAGAEDASSKSDVVTADPAA